ncbi:glycosyltransferase family 4 protein [Longimicrobium sp.]|uniref:glycosyltransferase family 4 protein n=1 Tax=Longimicrobium sp. TaxID=2029185 RepID=UPI002ED9C036
MNVLYLIGYPYRMAGSQRQIFELIVNLPAWVRPTVAVPDHGEVYDAFAAAGVDVVVVRPGTRMLQYGQALVRASAARRLKTAVAEWLPYTRDLVRLIRGRGIDLLHPNDIRSALMAGGAARWCGLPIVGHLQGQRAVGGAPWRVYERLVQRIIANAEPVRQSLTPRARAKCTTVYTGIRDVSGLGSPLPWLAGLRERGVAVVGCFASVVPFKGHRHLLHAAALLNERGWRDRVVFVCVGSMADETAEYNEWLVEEQRRLGLDNFIFAGWQADPYSFYRVTDVEVLPSVREDRLTIGGRVHEVVGHEGFPTTHLEAMWFGIPVVGTAIAAVPEQVEDGRTGLLVPPGDGAALADALERLLADPALRERMGRLGRERVAERFSLEAFVGQVCGVYQEIRPRPAAAA